MDKQLSMKTCSKCNLSKLKEDFYRPNRSSVCKVCHLEITREYKRQKRLNPDFVKNEGLKQKERRVRLWQNTLLHDCKNRNHEVDIDVDYINFLFKKQEGKCFWFGVTLIPSNVKKHPQQPSLERLDNTLGYIKGNVVLSCYSANIGRNETNKDIWIEFIKLINPSIY
jgi:hypothetical protein